ncbi:leucine-rich repeat and immunoglobulin-like domain-containing nogo receptor-interacting protein 1 [Heterodontus francisci]|uniref:leucine-rich repeat and immunoglobulin-like domain-containing nogo receptor-interacting protein 1 n=1 Tax=Heterodontus francisci TaxID=7792 RepID=UPI00355BD38F
MTWGLIAGVMVMAGARFPSTEPPLVFLLQAGGRMLTGAGPPDGSWLILLLLGPGLGCPSDCYCWPVNRTVRCSGRELEATPRGIPAWTRELDLSRNRLRRLDWGEGRGRAGSRRLEELDLSENLLSELETAPLGGLDKLRVLRLRANRLRYLPPGALSGLVALRALDLGDNPLLVLLDHSFGGLGRLVRLALGAPVLSYIGPQAWAGLGGLQQLTVQGAAITDLPAAALAQLGNLTVLRLRQLPNLGAVPSGSFQALSRLRVLELDGWSSLTELGPNSLLGLNLIWLSVTRCNLSAVPYASLRHQAYLRFLNLSHNPIRAIRGALLHHVTRLEELRLVGGNLVIIEPASFQGLVHFRLLDVSANQLASLEQTAFRSVGGLQSLGLGRNPLACDCRLLWIVRRRRRLRFLGHGPACTSPSQFRGRRLADLSDPLPPGSFSCRKPRIRDKRPQRLSAQEGQTVALRCAADGQPPPDILWLNPRRQRLGGPGPGPITGPGVGRSRLLPNGTLEIGSVRPQDAGTYRCVARNAGGNDTASASLQVRPLSPQELGLPGSGAEPGLRPGYPFNTRTLLIATSMGFASFLSVVALCFSLLFIWSRANGPIKHSIQVDFVPHGGGARGDGDEAKFNMKMV